MSSVYQKTRKNQHNSFTVTLQDVKNSLNLVELATDAGVELHPAGPGKLVGCCPFHSEKTPSFFVFTGRNRWVCFGCGQRGDSLDFLCRIRGRPLREILKEYSGGQWRPSPPDPVKVALKEKQDRFDAWQRRYSDDLSIYISAISSFLFRQCRSETLHQYAHLIQARAQAERTLDVLIWGNRRDRIRLYCQFSEVSA